MGVNASTTQQHGLQIPTSRATPMPILARGLSDAPSNDGFLPEILELLAEFLVGFDVLQLTHVCRAFHSALSTPSIWAWRVTRTIGTPPTPLPHGWCADQAAYFRSRSLQFRGLDGIPEKKTSRKRIFNHLLRIKHEKNCGDVVELPFRLLPVDDGRLSFDLWFSLLPDSDTPGGGGGILFGAQSLSCFTPSTTPHHIDRFVHIDPQRNLYCSVLVGKPVVAANLEVHRWYHLALAFDGRHQHVYLDGDLVSSGMGISKPQDKWHWVRNTQLGTGYIAESSRGKPTPTFSGWYPFLGLIDECRIWHDVVSEDQIKQLAQGRAITIQPVFQLTSEQFQRREGVQNVKCTRPMERQARKLLAPRASHQAS